METKVIHPRGKDAVQVSVPGSKSITHRMLIAAALAQGDSVIENGLVAEDTLLTMEGLCMMGARISREADVFSVSGTGGKLVAPAEAVSLGNSGTSIRLLTAVAALAQGETTLTGTERLRSRPIGELVAALNELDVACRTGSPGGTPPVTVAGAPIEKTRVSIDCRKSSQYLSGLLLIAPFARNGLRIEVTGGLVSKPYVDVTISAMQEFGVTVERRGYESFTVTPGQSYAAGRYAVEPDASSASYFFAAGAVTKKPVTVSGIRRSSSQGDARLVAVLESMGCRVADSGQGLTVCGGDLSPVTVDMGDMPDMVPTLAVVAAFAKGRTVIENVAHLAQKESDRLATVCSELSRLGVSASHDGTNLTVNGTGQITRGASIETHNDHRIAMAFAVAGLVTPGVVIENPACVAKSFPGFWEIWGKLY
ncbi:MAG: 3-phosphoshikimate 1-carboxyvinyltransferase [Thermodesulfobacteriota bacterium]